ncbi:hypothetical protein AB6A40_009406 [Gnathostoma spinigerum]|uniref:Uncharacterized protein n=1 Tax=Gnathostoma spinigerum TaxID=75299 RepID=A0ABD6F0L5_9BILA
MSNDYFAFEDELYSPSKQYREIICSPEGQKSRRTTNARDSNLRGLWNSRSSDSLFTYNDLHKQRCPRTHQRSNTDCPQRYRQPSNHSPVLFSPTTDMSLRSEPPHLPSSVRTQRVPRGKGSVERQTSFKHHRGHRTDEWNNNLDDQENYAINATNVRMTNI